MVFVKVSILGGTITEIKTTNIDTFPDTRPEYIELYEKTKITEIPSHLRKYIKEAIEIIKDVNPDSKIIDKLEEINKTGKCNGYLIRITFATILLLKI